MAILETAVPTTWLAAIETDPAFKSSEINNFVAGIYPAWYNSLPESVKQYATATILAEASSEYESDLLPTDSVVPPSTTLSDPRPSITSSPFGSTALALASGTTSTEMGTTGSSSSSAPSTTTSSTASTSTSRAGAPAATGMAMSLLGTAGILVLALAL
ncbi:hypothetical protein BDV35DRAFT_104978 [Aspergillus flavus]|nr:uncharacterized protein G4B84_009039 [Aspergillus flavus NRRL3357]KAB8250058.1 hypothetical protein BDV35DRAFT_104978 [Aspergillus flavus]KAF7622703.1 hypothetical protein AFLA_010025 [Aspergillus flavus NRRL3357]QMW33573.1 hypothetical protein G4B84_009039 [Aspergillus flavus NRRL3357]